LVRLLPAVQTSCSREEHKFCENVKIVKKTKIDFLIFDLKLKTLHDEKIVAIENHPQHDFSFLS
jgi:hypothetical protein